MTLYVLLLLAAVGLLAWAFRIARPVEKVDQRPLYVQERAKLSDYDAPSSLSFVGLVGTVIEFMRSPPSSSDQGAALAALVSQIGSRTLNDVTEVGPLRHLIAYDYELPATFVMRVFQFRDDSLGRGLLDVVFRDAELVNFRAQVFLEGAFGRERARTYLRRTLAPRYECLLGQPLRQSANDAIFHQDGVVGVARYLAGTECVSAWVIAEEFAPSVG